MSVLTGTGHTWIKVVGPALRLVAGGLSVSVLSPSSGREAWGKVGGLVVMVHLAIADDDLFALNSADDVWKWEGRLVWKNLGIPRWGGLLLLFKVKAAMRVSEHIHSMGRSSKSIFGDVFDVFGGRIYSNWQWERRLERKHGLRQAGRYCGNGGKWF